MENKNKKKLLRMGLVGAVASITLGISNLFYASELISLPLKDKINQIETPVAPIIVRERDEGDYHDLNTSEFIDYQKKLSFYKGRICEVELQHDKDKKLSEKYMGKGLYLVGAGVMGASYLLVLIGGMPVRRKNEN